MYPECFLVGKVRKRGAEVLLFLKSIDTQEDRAFFYTANYEQGIFTQ